MYSIYKHVVFNCKQHEIFVKQLFLCAFLCSTHGAQPAEDVAGAFGDSCSHRGTDHAVTCMFCMLRTLRMLRLLRTLRMLRMLHLAYIAYVMGTFRMCRLRASPPAQIITASPETAMTLTVAAAGAQPLILNTCYPINDQTTNTPCTCGF